MSNNIINYSFAKEKKRTKDNYFVAVHNSFMRNKELTIAEKAFFIYLQGFGEKCFQNQTTICKELQISKPTLRKLINSLETKKYIYVQRKYSSKTKEKSSPVIFPMPIDENTGLLSLFNESVLEHLEKCYPSDY